MAKITLAKVLSGGLRRIEKRYIMSQVRRSVFEPTPAIGVLQLIGGFATVAAYSATDQLTLRLLFATGTVLGGVIPNLARKPRLVLPAIWSGLFLSINGSRIAELLMQKVPIQFDEKDLRVYETTYYKYLTPNQYLKLLNISHYEVAAKGTKLKEENVPSSSLHLIINGSVSLDSVGSEVAVVKAEEEGQPNPYKFIGIPRHLELEEEEGEGREGEQKEDEKERKIRTEEQNETDNTAVEVVTKEEVREGGGGSGHCRGSGGRIRRTTKFCLLSPHSPPPPPSKSNATPTTD
jgi:hypothetical protein